MTRADRRRGTLSTRSRARLVLVGALGSLLLLGALSATAANGSPSSERPANGHTAFVVEREATITGNAASPARSHRLVVAGALLVVTCLAAIATHRRTARGRRTSRRRVEQFHVRLRGPPVLLVAF
jgi:hypothetical protein